ncbi:hypothetical protein HYU23_01695 [Candidatus Woesearchaeota archaeon]|nr:hypothetical protein [Candidatus Woesearchaeota archaeon]
MKEHPRISTMIKFYRDEQKVCPFMSPYITQFVLVQENYTRSYIANPLLSWVKFKDLKVLSYVWEKDPRFEDERKTAIKMFGDLAHILYEDQNN